MSRIVQKQWNKTAGETEILLKFFREIKKGYSCPTRIPVLKNRIRLRT